MSFSLTPDEGEVYLLNNALGGATLYIGLGVTADINTAPAEDDTLSTITEISGGGYSRQQVVFGDASTAGGATTADGAEVTFSFTGTPTGGDPTYAFLTDASSGTTGSLIGVVSLARALSIVADDTEKVTWSVEAQ